MATESLRILSPNMIVYSILESLISLNADKTATGSVADIMAPYPKQTLIGNAVAISNIPANHKKNDVNNIAITVPIIAYKLIVPKCWKNVVVSI